MESIIVCDVERFVGLTALEVEAILAAEALQGSVSRSSPFDPVAQNQIQSISPES